MKSWKKKNKQQQYQQLLRRRIYLFNLLQTATGLKDAVNIKITIKDVIMSDDICYIISKDDECYATNSSSALKDLKNVIAIFGTHEGITIIPKLKNIGGGKTVIQLFID